jgi:hypothetical protein
MFTLTAITNLSEANKYKNLSPLPFAHIKLAIIPLTPVVPYNTLRADILGSCSSST